MKKSVSEFKRFHPFVNFIYFAGVITFSMYLMHPVAQSIAFASAFTYSVLLKGRRAAVFNLVVLIPIVIITSLINPAFNHQGASIILYLPGGNPLTLESMIYGASAGMMLATAICWFSCFNEVMTSDKLMYLFGKVIPSLSLIFSMTLRFVPKFKTHLKAVMTAQSCIENAEAPENIIQKGKKGIGILSIMTMWSLENAIETADSMKGRGYGLSGRTTFSIFKFDKRDKVVFTLLLALIALVLGLLYLGRMRFQFFPMIVYNKFDIGEVLAFSSYLLLCLVPIAIEIWEVIRWKKLK